MKTNPYATETRYVTVGDRQIATDQEGYIQNMGEWSEDYARALAKQDGLELTDEHWQIIRFIREFEATHQVQPQVRTMIKHFTVLWGQERGNNHYLHDLFPRGGPQKQGNRLAGVRRTKGEH
ncbi:MAG: TusE/DsrC/DsvC family sulfur relay protein [Gammaproteobacteria bacterium]|nr:TusE/DsrC/DsvC family sulfur relay protein [Gammaproteobacteria bacterium]MBU1644880.1 TusE/DsrC/DsvC family sulfur relay protein [Gammaproteobacteria bacterium]MBU1971339.1 TusE/DsrC/DsvC family sulfur relay protein [Gammaproteobacteria bacterium]